MCCLVKCHDNNHTKDYKREVKKGHTACISRTRNVNTFFIVKSEVARVAHSM